MERHNISLIGKARHSEDLGELVVYEFDEHPGKFLVASAELDGSSDWPPPQANIQTGRYLHFKGRPYNVLGVGIDNMHLDTYIIYQALYEDPNFGSNTLWARPISLFTDTKTVDGKEIPRFRYIGDD